MQWTGKTIKNRLKTYIAVNYKQSAFPCEIWLDKHEKKRGSHNLQAAGAPATMKRQTAMV